MTAEALGPAVDAADPTDPWSPGYVTPAATPSPRGPSHRQRQRPPPTTPAGAGSAEGAPVAVSVREAHHVYVNYNFNGKTAVSVLNGFNMTVRQGNIYALLGSSGCGKTTVLRALVGQHRLTSGTVRVFGEEPRTKGIGIPGPSLGYMPQELAVPDGFTIRETLRYFGWLAGMASSDIDRQSDVLLRLLDLPSPHRLVCDLSGGQQRRVSLAVALLHSPPLLILDEPTVGVDPLIRQSVWEHLLDLTAGGRTTIIITTHYIDEARQAHVTGLMRRGALLAEDTPSSLLTRLSCSSLEDVLLRLCLLQDHTKTEDAERALHADGKRMEHEMEVMGNPDAEAVSQSAAGMKVELRTSKTSSKVKALLWKNVMWIWRHWVVSSILVVLPAFIACVYCGAVGAPPRDLHLAVVNEESDCSGWRGKVDCAAPRNLSCLFLDTMRASSALQLVMFPDKSAAEQAVVGGRAWGIAHFASNFSDSLMERAGMTISVDSPAGEESVGIIETSAVNVRLDMALQTIGYLLQQALYSVTSQALGALNGQCALNPHMVSPPLQFRAGGALQQEPSFLDYSLPGLILSVVFMFGFTTTMAALLPEKTDKILERSLVYGVRMSEVLAAQFTTQLVLVLAQISAVFFVVFALFRNLLLGPVFPYVLLCVAQGMCGMWYGLLVAVICDSTTAASLIGTGTYFSFVFLSSMLWPVEGMHMLLRPVAEILPMTSATISLRNIALRAWDIYHPGVFVGFLMTISWTIAFILLTFFVIKLRF